VITSPSASCSNAWDARAVYAESLALIKSERDKFAQWQHPKKSYIKRVSNSTSTKISASAAQVRAVVQEFARHIEGAKGEGDANLLQWTFFCLAEKICVCCAQRIVDMAHVCYDEHHIDSLSLSLARSLS
jgi:hypothetical protein